MNVRKRKRSGTGWLAAADRQSPQDDIFTRPFSSSIVFASNFTNA
jgi:hypothetical protein